MDPPGLPGPPGSPPRTQGGPILPTAPNTSQSSAAPTFNNEAGSTATGQPESLDALTKRAVLAHVAEAHRLGFIDKDEVVQLERLAGQPVDLTSLETRAVKSSLPARTPLQMPSTTTATASSTLIQHQNEAPALSREDLERLQHLPADVIQLYATGKLVLPGKGQRNGSQKQPLALAPTRGLPGAPKPQSPADNVQAQDPAIPPTPPAPGMTRSATNAPPVLEYLSKKGYKRTEATLRKESEEHDPISGLAMSSKKPDDAEVIYKAYELFRNFVDDSLEVYRPELATLLWPLFVYALLKLANDYYSKDAEVFFQAYSPQFAQQHPDEVRQLSTITQPTHVETSELAKRYLNNRYRIRMTKTAQAILYQWLEANEDKGTLKITALLNAQCLLISIDRAQLGNERGLAAMLARGSNKGYELPAEDEGIPGHNAGSANTNLNAPSALPKLQLGNLPKDVDMMEDLRDELEELDKQDPPLPGIPTLVEEFDRQIKREPTEDGPSRDVVPLPPPLAKDVAMEVQKIRELRDRFKIDPRTGGVGPGMSIIMYTFHNTEDSVNCIDFSGDMKMAAAGTREAYIRVWSLEGDPLPMNANDETPPASRRLFGHSGAIFNVAFSPSTEKPPISYNVDTKPSYLLSCSVDKTIRIWSLETYACVVIYKGHTDPVWDVRWSPHGHYFLSAGNDKTARLWTTEQIAAVRLFVGHDGAVEHCAWHPNGAYVFTAGQDRSVRMWDIASGRSVRMFTSHQGSITTLECAPNGKTLASADDQGTIILWDLESGRRIKFMRGHKNGGIWSLTWSMESTVLVSGGADCTVRVWDVELKSGAHGKVADGSGVKGDGVAGSATASATAAANIAGVGTQKKKKGESAATPDQISAFPTKRTPVYKVMFTHNNLVLSGGAYLPQRT